MFEARKILAPQWFATYKSDIDALASQCVKLNTNLFILEEIIKFDFNLFAADRKTFWIFVADSLFESCIMCAWRIALDTDSDCLTAAKLKNEILANLTDNDARKHLISELKRVDFDKRLKEVKQKIKEARDNLYAHLNKQMARAMAGGGHFPNVPLRGLKMVRNTLNEFIQVLGFEANYMFLPIDYNPSVRRPIDVDPRPDIVQLLDDIACKSEIIHWPEKDPTLWSDLRNVYSSVRIDKINMYRKKLGLPEA
jgi:hypothetical protein